MTDWSDFKKIGVVFKNRRVFVDYEHYIFICLEPQQGRIQGGDWGDRPP